MNVGPQTTANVYGWQEGALRALDVRLGESELSRLDEILPGPGGPAPEAYAW